MDSVRLRVEPAGVEIGVRHGETILEALKRSGYSMFFGCRRGGCGVCRIRVLEGQVTMAVYAPQALPPDMESQGYVLACRAQPWTDVVVQAEESNRLQKQLGWPFISLP